MNVKKMKRLLSILLTAALVLPASQMAAMAKPASDSRGGKGSGGQAVESAAVVASQETRKSGLVGFEGKYAISETSVPISVIVEFAHQPAKLVKAIADANGEEVDKDSKELNDLAKKDKEDFYNALKGIEYTVKYEYSLGMNGVAITVPQSSVDDIARLECVFAVYPNETHANVTEPDNVYVETESSSPALAGFPDSPAVSDESSNVDGTSDGQSKEEDVQKGEPNAQSEEPAENSSKENDEEPEDGIDSLNTEGG